MLRRSTSTIVFVDNDGRIVHEAEASRNVVVRVSKVADLGSVKLYRVIDDEVKNAVDFGNHRVTLLMVSGFVIEGSMRIASLGKALIIDLENDTYITSDIHSEIAIVAIIEENVMLSKGVYLLVES